MRITGSAGTADRRSELCRHDPGRQGRRIDGALRHDDGAVPPRAHRRRARSRGQHVRNHGVIHLGRACQRRHVRSSARSGRLSSDGGPQPPALPHQRRLHRRTDLQRQALVGVHRRRAAAVGQRPVRHTRAASTPDRHRVWTCGPNDERAYDRRMAGAVPRARDTRCRHQHTRCAVRQSPFECGWPVRDRANAPWPRAISWRSDLVLPHTGPGRRPRPRVGCRHRRGARGAWTDCRGRRTGAGLWIGAIVDFEMGAKATQLRGELRELVRSHVPEGFLGAFTDDPADLEVAQRFCRLLAERGLLCLSWPKEFGGGGASVWEQTVVREEMWAHHEPRGAQYMGVNWVGPTLMRYGTPDQRRKHLPLIARGEVIWCQGFSEPEAGSDLASLRTAARRDGDGWRISGQKIWTSYATMAQWCFLLARTSKGEKKQHGLTIFLVPMDDPAIRVRPIRAMLGPHHLNEVFFDDLKVTEADVLGQVDGGWSIVADVLSFERVGIARYARCERLLSAAPAVLGDRWDDLPAELRGRWARMLTHCRRARLLAYRVVGLQSAGRVQPGDAAGYRIAVTRLDQDSAEVLMEIVAAVPRGSGPQGAATDYFRAEVEDHWRYSQASTVASGSIEMQRILLSRALLAAK